METIIRKQLKFAIIGPESSGKSTLCQQLSRRYGCDWAPEFARLHLEKNPNYIQEDLDFFIDQQVISEQKFNSKFLFCDTDPISFKVWSLYKYGSVSKHITAQCYNKDYTHHLLLAPDLPYEIDQIREDSPLKNRLELFELFRKELDFHECNYSIVNGLGNIRLKNAIEIISTHI